MLLFYTLFEAGDCTSLQRAKKIQRMGLVSVLISSLVWCLVTVHSDFPTTLQGPFKPVTLPLDNNTFHGNAIDLPDTDPQVQRNVQGFEPEQISVSLSSNYDSVWISWITGLSFFAFTLFSASY